MKRTIGKITGTMAVIAAAFVLIAVPAFAATDLLAETKITMEQAEQTALSVQAGTITKVELKSKNGTAVFEVTVTGSDGKEAEVEINAASGTVSENKTKAAKEDKAALKTLNQTLKTKWTGYTAAEKEQVYALKDAEFDAQISEINSEVTSGYKTQSEADQAIADINNKKARMRTSGEAPSLKKITELP